ncbi:hypothetical protein D3C79_328300 [compost metagenome]
MSLRGIAGRWVCSNPYEIITVTISEVQKQMMKASSRGSAIAAHNSGRMTKVNGKGRWLSAR